jgi:GR25 family glycosyltransferase involved in LPS biosynthesis
LASGYGKSDTTDGAKMKRKFVFQKPGKVVQLYSMFPSVLLAASLFEALLSSFEAPPQPPQIEGIDFIYLINLDKRVEKWEASSSQLSFFHILPHRFSAIYGWELPPALLNETGLKFQEGMRESEWAIHFLPSGEASYDFLRDACYGKRFFSRWMTRGAIGCALSHLSILQHAYDAGYETILVLEDDIRVAQDPRDLGPLIKQLDNCLGSGNWDVLYTDLDTNDAPLYSAPNDFESDLKGKLWWMWRPDMPSLDLSPFAKRSILNEHFLKIGSRMRTHSMVIRKSGMKKILDYGKEKGLFLPYDHEISLVPGIELYSLRYPLITHAESVSDTQERHF